MPACSAYGCKQRDRSNNRTLHRFPKDEVMRKKWIHATRLKNFNPSKSAILCSQHFREEDFDKTRPNYVMLKEGVIPSVFKGFPSHLQKEKKTRKPPVKRIVSTVVGAAQSKRDDSVTIKDTSHATTIKDTSHATTIKDTSHNTTIKDTSHATAIKDTSHATAIKDTSHVTTIKDTSHTIKDTSHTIKDTSHTIMDSSLQQHMDTDDSTLVPPMMLIPPMVLVSPKVPCLIPEHNQLKRELDQIKNKYTASSKKVKTLFQSKRRLTKRNEALKAVIDDLRNDLVSTNHGTAVTSVKSSPLHVVSPLIPSTELSDVCGQQAVLKLENIQPSGSFKIRGIGHYIQKSIESGCDRVVSSSGGNAGMAAAYASKIMEIPATIVIPNSTPSFMISKLKQEKAEVIVHGEVWDVAHKKAITLAEDENCCLVHPFDHEDIWEGHSTIVDEILEQSTEEPAAIVVSVGGGGLLCGILCGLHIHGANDIPVVAMETEGAHCLRAALDAGKPVPIGEITSIAKTLGALCVTQGVFDLKEDIQLSSHVVSDKQAVEACINFADHHRILVEPSCGAVLAAGYSGLIQELKENNFITKEGPVVFVICGGNIVSMDNLMEWKKQFKID